MKNIVFDIETIPDMEACAAANFDAADRFPTWPLNEIMCASLFSIEQSARGAMQFDLVTVSRADTGERRVRTRVVRRVPSHTHATR